MALKDHQNLNTYPITDIKGENERNQAMIDVVAVWCKLYQAIRKPLQNSGKRIAQVERELGQNPLNISIGNRLIYSCMLSNLAFEWKRGWRRLPLGRNLCAIHMHKKKMYV